MKAVKLFTLFAITLALSACISHGRQEEILPAAESERIPENGVTIALLGGTGMAGSFILAEALAQGYDVRALARTPAKLDALKNHITIIPGDARDPTAIDTLLLGSDVVISALGPVKADGNQARMISSDVTALLLKKMQPLGIQRYIIVSGAAVEMPGDERNMTGWLVEHSAAITLRDTLKDKQNEYELLAASDSQWTLVRCPLIKPADFLRPAKVSLETPGSFSLRAGELARFIIEQIDSQKFIRKGPFLSSN